ncbi:hypothetical protein [Paenibacillus roseus]|nr:hypothetical protein [Paenibacillus roseus]
MSATAASLPGGETEPLVVFADMSRFICRYCRSQASGAWDAAQGH